MTLDRALPEDRVVVLDSGRFMTSPARFIRVPEPGCFRLTADAGSIAIGLGVALGAAIARPKAANVLFVGDGGLSMSMGDLETAARNAVRLIVVVMNDRAYGAEYVHLQADGLPPNYAALPEIDFAGVARALGIEALDSELTERARGRGASPAGAARAAVDRLPDPPGHHGGTAPLAGKGGRVGGQPVTRYHTAKR